MPVRLLARYRYPTSEYVAKRRCPLLVAHSPNDEIVPYRFGRKVFEAAAEPKQFLEMRGDHNGGFDLMGSEYEAALDRFLAPLFPRGESE